MNTGLKIAGIVVAGLALVAGGAFAGAQVAQANALSGGPDRQVVRIEPETLAGYHDKVEAAMADALDMSVDELKAALRSGQSIEEIAEEKGITTEQLEEAMLKAQGEILAQAVKDGKLTQAQANELLGLMKEHPGMGMGSGFPMMGRPGMRFGPEGFERFDGPNSRLGGPRHFQFDQGGPDQHKPDAPPAPDGSNS